MLTLLSILLGCTTVHVTRVQSPSQELDTAIHFWLNPFNLWNAAFGRHPAEADEDATGIRFYHVRPYLLVEPDNDGGVKVETQFLPDYTNQYAVESHVYLASQDFSVTIADGLLTKVSYKPDQTAMLNELIKSSGVVGETVITEQAEAAAEAKKAQTELANLVTAATEAKDRAEFDAEQADTAVTAYKAIMSDPPTAAEQTKLAELEAKKREADFEFDKKSRELARLVDQASASGLLDSTTQQVVSETPSVEDGRLTVPGPVLFAIAISENGVELKPVKFDLGNTLAAQPEVVTFKPAKAKAAEKKPLELAGEPPEKQLPAGGRYVVNLRFKSDLSKGVTEVAIAPTSSGQETGLEKRTEDSPDDQSSYFVVEGDVLRVVLSAVSDAFPPGRYVLTVSNGKHAGEFANEIELAARPLQ